MSRFRRENGKKVEKIVYTNLHIRKEVYEQFREIANYYDMTHTDLLVALMDGHKARNGKPIAPLLTQFEKLLADFQAGKGLFDAPVK